MMESDTDSELNDFFFQNESHLDYEFMQGPRADSMLLNVKNDKHFMKFNDFVNLCLNY
jgi:hypothetical protein